MKITKSKIKQIIKEEIKQASLSEMFGFGKSIAKVAEGNLKLPSPDLPWMNIPAKKSTDLEYARSSPRDQIGVQEATQLLNHLEDMGYVSSRGAVTQLTEFLQALEENEDIRHGGRDQ